MSQYRSPAYELAFTWLREVVPVLGKLPSQRAIGEYLKNNHGITSTTQTLKRICEHWLADPENQALFTSPTLKRELSSKRTSADHNQAETLLGALDSKHRRAIEAHFRAIVEAELHDKIVAAQSAQLRAETSEKLTQQQTAIELRSAADRVLSAEATSKALRQQLDDVNARLDAYVQALPDRVKEAVDVALNAANAAHEKAVDVLRETIAEKQRLIEAGDKRYDELRVEMTHERISRDQAENERYSGLNRVLGQQIADLKSARQALEKELLKATQRAEATASTVIGDAIKAVSAQLEYSTKRSEATLAGIDVIAKAMVNEVRIVVNESGRVVRTVAKDEVLQQLKPLLALLHKQAASSENTSPTTNRKRRPS